MKIDDNVIHFYSKDKPFGFLSNFYPSPFSVGKILYKTNEHYFQSKKFQGHPEYQKRVIDAATPAQAFKVGRDKKGPIRGDWQAVKEDVMYEGLRLKFQVHKDLCQKLLQTGDKKLVEHTFKDKYWADGGNGQGKNRLGILLMKLRAEIKKKREEQAKKK